MSFLGLGIDWECICLKLFPLQGSWSAMNHMAQNSCRPRDRIWDKHFWVTGVNPSPGWKRCKCSGNFVSITMAHPTKPGLKGEVGGASTPQLSRYYSRHMSVPCTRHCSECFACINPFTLHNNPMKYYLNSHFIDNTTEGSWDLSRVSYQVSGRAGIWM